MFERQREERDEVAVFVNTLEECSLMLVHNWTTVPHPTPPHPHPQTQTPPLCEYIKYCHSKRLQSSSTRTLFKQQECVVCGSRG